eukprot:2165297-Amphidinium_carterae.1
MTLQMKISSVDSAGCGKGVGLGVWHQLWCQRGWKPIECVSQAPQHVQTYMEMVLSVVGVGRIAQESACEGAGNRPSTRQCPHAHACEHTVTLSHTQHWHTKFEKSLASINTTNTHLVFATGIVE